MATTPSHTLMSIWAAIWTHSGQFFWIRWQVILGRPGSLGEGFFISHKCFVDLIMLGCSMFSDPLSNPHIASSNPKNAPSNVHEN